MRKHLSLLLLLLPVLPMIAACSGTSGPASTSASTASAASAEPVADCVDPAEQATSGVTVSPGPGVTVDALMSGAGTTGIVFANMLEGDLCQWLPTARDLATKGYRTAVFNYSGRQGSTDDLLAVTAALRRRGATSIALVGASKGGTTVISAATRARAVAVVDLSGPRQFEDMDALGPVGTLTVPTFFAVGSEDGDFPASAKELYAASPARVKHLEVVATSDHGTALMSGPAGPLVIDFLTKNAPVAG